jgi:hypothetical protein
MHANWLDRHRSSSLYHEPRDSPTRCGGLTEDIPDRGLQRGQGGIVVELLGSGVFEVEFVDNGGSTYAVLPLKFSQLLVLHYQPV